MEVKSNMENLSIRSEIGTHAFARRLESLLPLLAGKADNLDTAWQLIPYSATPTKIFEFDVFAFS